MKFRLHAATVAISGLIFVGQSFAQTPQTSPGRDQDNRNQQRQTTTQSSQTAANPVTARDKAVEISHAEIHMAEMALSKSQNQRVKDYAQMLIRDHTRTLERLSGTRTSSDTGRDANQQQADRGRAADQDQADSQIAGREKPGGTAVDRSVMTREHQQAADRLNRLSGNEFDRESINLMVQDHRKAIQTFEQYARPGAGNQGARRDSTQPQTQTGRPTDDATLAAELLPTLRQHLTQAEQIQKELRSTNTR